jgi:hypothetical protein
LTKIYNYNIILTVFILIFKVMSTSIINPSGLSFEGSSSKYTKERYLAQSTEELQSTQVSFSKDPSSYEGSSYEESSYIEEEEIYNYLKEIENEEDLQPRELGVIAQTIDLQPVYENKEIGNITLSKELKLDVGITNVSDAGAKDSDEMQEKNVRDLLAAHELIAKFYTGKSVSGVSDLSPSSVKLETIKAIMQKSTDSIDTYENVNDILLEVLNAANEEREILKQKISDISQKIEDASNISKVILEKNQQIENLLGLLDEKQKKYVTEKVEEIISSRKKYKYQNTFGDNIIEEIVQLRQQIAEYKEEGKEVKTLQVQFKKLKNQFYLKEKQGYGCTLDKLADIPGSLEGECLLRRLSNNQFCIKKIKDNIDIFFTVNEDASSVVDLKININEDISRPAYTISKDCVYNTIQKDIAGDLKRRSHIKQPTILYGATGSGKTYVACSMEGPIKAAGEKGGVKALKDTLNQSSTMYGEYDNRKATQVSKQPKKIENCIQLLKQEMDAKQKLLENAETIQGIISNIEISDIKQEAKKKIKKDLQKICDEINEKIINSKLQPGETIVKLAKIISEKMQKALETISETLSTARNKKYNTFSDTALKEVEQKISSQFADGDNSQWQKLCTNLISTRALMVKNFNADQILVQIGGQENLKRYKSIITEIINHEDFMRYSPFYDIKSEVQQYLKSFLVKNNVTTPWWQDKGNDKVPICNTKDDGINNAANIAFSIINIIAFALKNNIEELDPVIKGYFFKPEFGADYLGLSEIATITSKEKGRREPIIGEEYDNSFVNIVLSNKTLKEGYNELGCNEKLPRNSVFNLCNYLIVDAQKKDKQKIEKIEHQQSLNTQYIQQLESILEEVSSIATDVESESKKLSEAEKEVSRNMSELGITSKNDYIATIEIAHTKAMATDNSYKESYTRTNLSCQFPKTGLKLVGLANYELFAQMSEYGNLNGPIFVDEVTPIETPQDAEYIKQISQKNQIVLSSATPKKTIKSLKDYDIPYGTCGAQSQFARLGSDKTPSTRSVTPKTHPDRDQSLFLDMLGSFRTPEGAVTGKNTWQFSQKDIDVIYKYLTDIESPYDIEYSSSKIGETILIDLSVLDGIANLIEDQDAKNLFCAKIRSISPDRLFDIFFHIRITMEEQKEQNTEATARQCKSLLNMLLNHNPNVMTVSLIFENQEKCQAEIDKLFENAIECHNIKQAIQKLKESANGITSEIEDLKEQNTISKAEIDKIKRQKRQKRLNITDGEGDLEIKELDLESLINNHNQRAHRVNTLIRDYREIKKTLDLQNSKLTKYTQNLKTVLNKRLEEVYNVYENIDSRTILTQERKKEREWVCDNFLKANVHIALDPETFLLSYIWRRSDAYIALQGLSKFREKKPQEIYEDFLAEGSSLQNLAYELSEDEMEKLKQCVEESRKEFQEQFHEHIDTKEDIDYEISELLKGKEILVSKGPNNVTDFEYLGTYTFVKDVSETYIGYSNLFVDNIYIGENTIVEILSKQKPQSEEYIKYINKEITLKQLLESKRAKDIITQLTGRVGRKGNKDAPNVNGHAIITYLNDLGNKISKKTASGKIEREVKALEFVCNELKAPQFRNKKMNAIQAIETLYNDIVNSTKNNLTPRIVEQNYNKCKQLLSVLKSATKTTDKYRLNALKKTIEARYNNNKLSINYNFFNDLLISRNSSENKFKDLRSKLESQARLLKVQIIQRQTFEATTAYNRITTKSLTSQTKNNKEAVELQMKNLDIKIQNLNNELRAQKNKTEENSKLAYTLDSISKNIPSINPTKEIKRGISPTNRTTLRIASSARRENQKEIKKITNNAKSTIPKSIHTLGNIKNAEDKKAVIATLTTESKATTKTNKKNIVSSICDVTGAISLLRLPKISNAINKEIRDAKDNLVLKLQDIQDNIFDESYELNENLQTLTTLDEKLKTLIPQLLRRNNSNNIKLATKTLQSRILTISTKIASIVRRCNIINNQTKQVSLYKKSDTRVSSSRPQNNLYNTNRKTFRI